MPQAYALLGPTASGKSRLALDLAAGPGLEGRLEIVSMDSAHVYRHMDIGTAKPSAAERGAVPHHLIDLVDPDRSYSTGRWREACLAAVRDVLSRSAIPLLVGGTMLYYRALTRGLDALPAANAAVRAELDSEAAQRGWPALHAELARVDAASAARIAPADAQRIQRALEVWRITGRALSAQHGAAAPGLPFELRAFALVPERPVLHERIARRFDAMLAAGLVDEVRALRARFRLEASMPSMRAVGYRQVWEHLEGATGAAEMKERAIAATRQLAKRQLTWLRSFPEVEVLPADGAAERLAHSFL